MYLFYKTAPTVAKRYLLFDIAKFSTTKALLGKRTILSKANDSK
jgi:hypothetical protein